MHRFGHVPFHLKSIEYKIGKHLRNHQNWSNDWQSDVRCVSANVWSILINDNFIVLCGADRRIGDGLANAQLNLHWLDVEVSQHSCIHCSRWPQKCVVAWVAVALDRTVVWLVVLNLIVDWWHQYAIDHCAHLWNLINCRQFRHSVKKMPRKNKLKIEYNKMKNV